MSKKLSKEDVKSPDQVTQALRQGFVWTTGHSKLVMSAIAAFIVIGLGVSTVGYLNDKKESEQQERYYVLEKSYMQKKQGFEETVRAEQMALTAKDKSKVPPVDANKKASGDMEKDYGTLVADFNALVKDSPKTKAGQMAALNVSEIYMTYGKYNEAEQTLLQVEPSVKKSSVLASLVWLQLGNTYANKGDCQGAVTHWQKVVGSKSLSYAHGEAKLRMGLCYETMNDVAKAEELYTEVSKAEGVNGDMAASQEAKKYLRLLKAKKSL